MPLGQLGHLTALTRLHTDGGVVVAESSVLPPNLVRLCVQRCKSLKPLQPLESLRQLTLGDGTNEAQLQEVRSSLPEVDIRIVSEAAAHDKPDCHCAQAEAGQQA